MHTNIASPGRVGVMVPMNQNQYHGYRVAIVGSCQVVGLRRWVERMLPGAIVYASHLGASPNSSPEQISSSIAGHDLVISQVPDGLGAGELDLVRLQESHRLVIFLPTLVFTGFHPDIVIYELKTNPISRLMGPFDDAQSAIIIAGYHLGLPPTRVPRLFNAHVFESVGYFATFGQAKAALVKIFAEHGYDLSEAVDAWVKGGSFMYFVNHPHIRVLGTLARLALEKAGLEFADPQEEIPPPDDLSKALQWPVYPALARRLGCGGSLSFLRAIGRTPADQTRELSLEKFVLDTYQQLEASVPLGFHDNPRVETAVDALRKLLSVTI